MTPARGTASTAELDRRAGGAPASARVAEAKVLVALDELSEAERILTDVLERHPDDLTALNLFAKVKHINGELSHAVACWAQLHRRSPHNELALSCLASLFELARNPRPDVPGLSSQRLADGFDPGLETAFRQLMAGRAEDAMATCGRLAQTHRGTNRELYKLCIIARAWIAELSGDLALARSTLEELGRERGFETDTDRVLGLARIYERIGDPKHLEDAVRVHRWLHRSFEKISAQSRLAALHRKLGNRTEAEQHERRFQLAFEHRMHRPSRAELARVAGERFLPLVRLAAARTSSDGSTDALSGATPRQRALFAFLGGDRATARAHFEHAPALMDRKYLGSLLALESELDAAVDVMLEALEADPHDSFVASFLLTEHDGPRAERIARAMVGALGESTREGLDRAIAASPRRPVLWLAMSTLLRARGQTAEAARHAGRARVLEDAKRRDERTVGRVLSAAVYLLAGKSKGLVHQIWADRKPAAPGRGGSLHSDDVLGNVTPEMRQAVRNTFLAVREYARSRFPHRTADILDHDYTFKVTKEDETSGGLSAGLPTAIAFLSVFLQEPIPQDIAFSGVLIADAHDVLVVRRVGDAEYKVKAAYHRNLRAILLPFENRHELVESRVVPRVATDEIARFVSSFDEAVTQTFGDRIWLE